MSDDVVAPEIAAGQARGALPGPPRGATPHGPGTNRRAHAGFLKSNLRDYGMLLSLFAIMLFFEAMTGGTLLRPLNLTNLVLQNSYIVIMALGMLLVIVSGHIDLSVGSVAGFVGAAAAVMMVTYHLNLIPATILCLLLGAAIGAAQGYWIAYFKIPSFIVTLAGMLVFKGLDPGRAAGAVGRTVSGDLPEAVLGLHPRAAAERRPALSDLGAARHARGAGAGRDRHARRARVQRRHGMEVEPTALFLARTIVLLAVMVYLTTLPSPRIAACPTCS